MLCEEEMKFIDEMKFEDEREFEDKITIDRN